MDLNYLKKVLKIFDQSSLTDLTIEEEGIKISLSKKNSIIQNSTLTTIPQPTIAQSIPSGANIQPVFLEKETKTEKEFPSTSSLYHKIVSPIVGTFYRSPSPDSEPFVEVGSRVTPGQTICIVEAMKVMNEIESDVAGTVVEILVENGKPVEYNQTLMLIKPD
ncbi:MAG: acetyl-CoA carboxylase biotin carboxyl carrier protein [Candidatus Kapaibacteriales bacterium]